MKLEAGHIDYIIKDLNYRGIVADGIQEELIDHVCTSVEILMGEGKKFMDAYEEVLMTFGNTRGLQKTQEQILKVEYKKTKVMLRNYFLIALRNLRKHRFYTLINILGLAIGVASCLIIVLYVLNELSFDRHHADAERIYRVDCEIKFGANHMRLAVTPGPMAETFRYEFPEIETSARFWDNSSKLVKRVDQNIKEDEVVMADSTIFDVFTIPMLEGNPHHALREPYSMVISKKIADKYFPNENPMGQSLIIENKEHYKITGVFEDMPGTSHFHFNIMLSLVSDPYHKDPQWLSNNFVTYLKLRKGTDPKSLEAKFPGMVDKYAGPQAVQALGNDFSMEKFRAAGNKIEFTLRPITEIHLHSDMGFELGVNNDIAYVYLFGAIAIFILAIACINFMNLSTARSSNRAKEVGIRKVMGSLRHHLVRQFLSESILLSLFAMIIALAIAWMMMPSFNELSGKELFLPLGDKWFWIILLASGLLVGVMAGIYPSFFLSAFRPVNVLKGNVSLGMKSGIIRSALVVFQFSISIILIIGTIAVNRQLSFIQNKKIGFNKDQVIIIKDTYALGEQIQAFKDEGIKDSRIKSGTISGFLPVSTSNRSDQTYWPEGAQPTQDNMVSTQSWRVDYDYVKTLGMNITLGRDFSPEFPSDSNSVILNQSAIKMFGLEGDPIGKKISTFAGVVDNTSKPLPRSWTVIGVVEDFHFESLKQTITPLAFFLAKSTRFVSFRFEGKNAKDVISSLESTWKKMAPGMPFSYSFLDQDFGTMYAAEQRLGNIVVIFAGLAILIASLGLFALTAFTAEQRAKEIGIRKVLGASVNSIVMLLSKEFGKLIIIAFVLAAPLAWFVIDRWLNAYTYKAEIGWSVYFIAGLIAFLIAWLTMGYQSIKAASTDPVKSLRSE